jgi:hypothetical protein
MKRKATEARHNALSALGKESFVTQSGIHKLLRTVEQDGIPPAYSPATQYRARKTTCSERTPYGRLVESVVVPDERANITLAIQNPLAMLYKMASSSDAFARLLLERLALLPCTPGSKWRIVIYQDGVNPSDGLAKFASRKAAAFYWSFLELGMYALAKEEVWFTITVVRESVMKSILGGYPRVTGICLKFFFDPDGDDIERAGITVYPNGEMRTMFAVLGCILADGPALKDVIGSKGHSGMKPCVLCLNGTDHKPPGGAEPLHDHSEYLVSIAEPNLKRFKKHTDESLRGAMQKLRGYRLTLDATAFEAMQSFHGLNWNEWSLLMNTRIMLSVVSSLMYDWAHCLVCDGIADGEFGMFMKHMHVHRTRTTYAEVGAYISAWTVPKGLGDVRKLFTPSGSLNNIKKGSFTCMASQFLTLTPMLILYLTRVCLPRGECIPQVLSMIEVLLLIEILQAVKRGVVTPAKLRRTIVRHRLLFQAAYGDENVRPKHHWVLHLPDILWWFGTLLTTLTHERKHRMVRRYCLHRTNLTSWEHGIVEDITCHALFDAMRDVFAVSLLKGHDPRPRIEQARERFISWRSESAGVTNGCLQQWMHLRE